MESRRNLLGLAVLVVFCLCGAGLAEWSEPVPVDEVNTEMSEGGAFLSYDGLTLYFNRRVSNVNKIYEATRDVPYGAFSSVTQIMSSRYHVYISWVSPDNLRMYYHNELPSAWLLKVSERASEDDAWSAGANVSELNALGDIHAHSLTGDELIIVLASPRIPGGTGYYDLWIGSRPDRGSPFGNVRELSEINTTEVEGSPYITPDGLTLYFASDRNGDWEIFRTSRESVDDLFGSIELLSFFGTSGGPALSSDGNAFYFNSGGDIYVSYLEEDDDGLVAHWKFDEGDGSVAYDSAGDNDGVVYGAQWADGILGGALEFGGASDYVDVASSEELKLNSAGTVAAWVKTRYLYRRGIVNKRGSTEVGVIYDNYLLTFGSYDQCTIVIGDGSDHVYATIPEEDLAVNAWQHVVGTWDSSEIRIYLNGDLWDAQPNTLSDLLRGDAYPVAIGRHALAPGYWHFDGLIDDVRIYDVALSAGEIEELYGEAPVEPVGLVSHWRFDEGGGSIAYDSAGSNDGAVYGAEWVDGVLGGALEFDGVNDHVDVPSAPELKLNSAGTVSAWVSTRYLYRRGIVNKRGSSELGVIYENYLLTFGTFNQCTIVIGDSVNRVDATIPEEYLAVNAWQHVVGTWDSSEISIYLDGNLIDVQPNTLSDLVRGDAYPVKIGCLGSNLWDFDGLIDDVRIYDFALSSEEIAELFGEVTLPSREYHIDGVLGSDDNDGLSRETAFFSIGKGIDTAEDGDSVLVWPGVYAEEVRFKGKAITVRSAGDAATIENPGDFAVSFYYGEGPGSVLKNFVIANSLTGIFIAGSSPTISNVTVVNNMFGIEAYAGSEPDISNAILWDNIESDIYGCEAAYSWIQSDFGPAAPLDGLVAHWKFDEGEGTTAYDSAGDNDGVVYGAQWAHGVLDGALSLDGVDDCVALPDNSPVWLPEYDFTYSAWVCFDASASVSGQEVLLDLNWTASSNPTNDNGCILLMKDSGEMFFGLTTITNVDEKLYSNPVFAEGEWYHIVALRGGTSQAIYVNGNLDNNRTCSASQIDFAGGSYDDDGVSIGRTTTVNSPSGVFYLDGKIDDVRIYNQALSAEGIAGLYELQTTGDPLFANPGAGDYHLCSERGRYWAEHNVWVLDDVSSPCLDAGDPEADYSAEREPNGGIINMGAFGGTYYASMTEWLICGDVNGDGVTNMVDFSLMAGNWLGMCGSPEQPPADTTPPEPDPASWDIEPYATSSSSILMAATAATDDNGVEYYFENMTIGGHSSGWQESANWTDSSLDSSTEYCYRVKTRDKSANANECGWSSTFCATTSSGGR